MTTTDRVVVLASAAILAAALVYASGGFRAPAKAVRVYTPPQTTYQWLDIPAARAKAEREADEAVEKARQRAREAEQDHLNFMLQQRLRQDALDRLMEIR